MKAMKWTNDQICEWTQKLNQDQEDGKYQDLAQCMGEFSDIV